MVAGAAPQLKLIVPPPAVRASVKAACRAASVQVVGSPEPTVMFFDAAITPPGNRRRPRSRNNHPTRRLELLASILVSGFREIGRAMEVATRQIATCILRIHPSVEALRIPSLRYVSMDRTVQDPGHEAGLDAARTMANLGENL